MNPRTGEIAHDVAWARPPSIPGAMILGYNGSAQPSREQVAAWGRPFLMGFESSTTRAYAGGDAGEADSAFSAARFDAWGYPRDAGSWVCAADANSTPGQFLANIREYGRRYAVRQVAGGRRGPIAAYGNPAAVEACCAGLRDGGVTALRWGVGTWGYGEGGGPNRPPAQANAEVIQSGNTPGQAEGTDLNWLYADVAVFAAFGGPDAAVPIVKELPEMFVGLKAIPGGAPNDYNAAWVDGGVVIRWFGGPMTPLGYLQAPQTAVEFAAREPKPRVEILDDGEWDPIEKRTVATQGGSGSTAVDTAALAMALAALLPQPSYTISGRADPTA